MPTTRFAIDKRLDQEINGLMHRFRSQGYYDVTKRDVLRLLVNDFKRREGKIRLYRPPKKSEFRLI